MAEKEFIMVMDEHCDLILTEKENGGDDIAPEHEDFPPWLKSDDWLAAGESLKIRLRFGFELDAKAVDWFG